MPTSHQLIEVQRELLDEFARLTPDEIRQFCEWSTSNPAENVSLNHPELFDKYFAYLVITSDSDENDPSVGADPSVAMAADPSAAMAADMIA